MLLLELAVDRLVGSISTVPSPLSMSDVCPAEAPLLLVPSIFSTGCCNSAMNGISSIDPCDCLSSESLVGAKAPSFGALKNMSALSGGFSLKTKKYT